MKTWVWIVIGGLTIGAILMLGSGKIAKIITPQQSKPVIPTKKIKLPRSTTITQVSAEQLPPFGICSCVDGKLTGPQCYYKGHSCSFAKKMLGTDTGCTCGPDGITTGLNCPAIGQPCQDLNLYYKPAHVRTKCPPNTILMEGGQCVRAWDEPNRNPDISAV